MRRSIIVAAFEEARRQGDAAAMCRTAAALARHDERIVRRIAPFIGFVAAVVLILTVLLTAHVALGSTPVPAVGQLAAWSTDTVPSVSVPSSPLVASSGGDGGGQASGLRSTVPTPAPEVSPSDPPPQSGPDDGVGGGEATTGDGVVPDESSGDSDSPSPPLDEIWTCDDIPLTAGVATWANLGTSYDDLTADPACHRGGPDPEPPPTTTTTLPDPEPIAEVDCDLSRQVSTGCAPGDTVPVGGEEHAPPPPESDPDPGCDPAQLIFANSGTMTSEGFVLVYRMPDGDVQFFADCTPVTS